MTFMGHYTYVALGGSREMEGKIIKESFLPEDFKFTVAFRSMKVSFGYANIFLHKEITIHDIMCPASEWYNLKSKNRNI